MYGHTTRLAERETRRPEDLSVDDGVIFFALRDSQRVHARQLMRFLYPPERPWVTDICAEDYVPDIPERLPWWDPINRKYNLAELDKNIGHLSYHRLVIHDFSAMMRNLGAALFAFIEAVPDSRVVPDFKREALTALQG